MTAPYEPARSSSVDLCRAEDDRSLGELFGTLTSDMSTLLRAEIELARIEIKEEVAKAGGCSAPPQPPATWRCPAGWSNAAPIGCGRPSTACARA